MIEKLTKILQEFSKKVTVLNENTKTELKLFLIMEINNAFYKDGIHIENVLFVNKEDYSEKLLQKYENHIFVIEDNSQLIVEFSDNVKNLFQ